MKLFYSLILCLILIFPAMGQVMVFDDDNRLGYGKFKHDDLEDFKKTTTIFIIGNESKEEERKQIELAFKAAWKVTPYKVVSIDDGAEYKDKKGYSFFTSSTLKFVEGKDNYYRTTFLLQVRTAKKLKTLATIEFDTENDPETNFPNTFQPGILKCYLGIISNYLTDEKTLLALDLYKNNDALKKLQKDTLYVPEYVLSLTKNSKDKMDVEKLMADYKYPYKFVKGKDLNDRIMKTNEAFNFYLYIIQGSKEWGFSCVFNSQLNDAVMIDHDHFVFGPKMFKDLNRRIAQQK